MELTMLKYFVEVAKTGSQNHAAKKLHISQSAISRQLKLLESETGQQLFFRTSTGLSLTAAGKKLLESAEEIIRLSELAITSMAEIKPEIDEPLYIGFMDIAFSAEATRIIERFKRIHPKVQLSIFSGVHEDVQSMLKNNEIDVACIFYYQEPDGNNFIRPGITKSLGILTHKDDILATERVDSRLLETIPMIVPHTEINNPDRTQKLPFNILNSNIMAQTDNTFAFIDMVLQRKAYLFCVEPESEWIKRLPLVFRPVTMPIITLYYIQAESPRHKESTKAFMNFITDDIV